MASNSDTIFHVLNYIKTHPDKVIPGEPKYKNVVSIFLDDKTKVGNPEIYFPDQKLAVNRMTEDFIAKNGDLLDFFHNQTNVRDQNYHTLWVTSGHLVNKHKYLVDLSFE
ncbi:hypothetical protein PL11_010180 [Lentilactobacillus curieae]|uniref:Uncharacterized protein n=1 Tax=Lentilactobacillus curieae TaxID=1138822 RepID=A0A1S6QKY1_9LACO|nr:hypothetical protein [Lentilactobacillus curieae]AQW22274.1 hypothetical protein PL11_010180 [Lentilactobacillus curieae]